MLESSNQNQIVKTRCSNEPHINFSLDGPLMPMPTRDCSVMLGSSNPVRKTIPQIKGFSTKKDSQFIEKT
jgi:hypothetical protein